MGVLGKRQNKGRRNEDGKSSKSGRHQNREARQD